MDMNRRLPANPEVPQRAETDKLVQAELRKLCSKFGIALSFKSRESGKQENISNRVLRQRLEELRTGYLRARFLKGGEPGDEPDEEAEADAKQAPEATPEVEATKSVESVPAAPTVPPAEDDDLARLIAERLKGGGMKEEKVKAIAIEAATKAVSSASSMFLAQVKSEVAKQVAALPATRFEVFTPTGETKAIDRPHCQFGEVLDLAQMGDPVLMVGPAGCGKSTIGRNISSALSLSFHYLACTIETSKGDLFGRQDFKTGEWMDGPVTKCAEQGGVCLIDEIDGADGNTLLSLNTLMDLEEWYIPRRPASRFKKHKDFRLIAAANTYGHGADRVYSGRNQLDAATLDRFRSATVEVDYDKVLEKELCDAGVLNWGWKVRDAIRNYSLRKVMSTRTLIKFSNQVRAKRADGTPMFTLEQCKKRFYSDWSLDDKKKVAV